jgi:hypothetical protein
MNLSYHKTVVRFDLFALLPDEGFMEDGF